ncbi:MAG: DUF1834 family protein [Deltaproteobacteria bacterium]|nr:DUF1834 family protein [Deltaproteobacteria bacterium]
MHEFEQLEDAAIAALAGLSDINVRTIEAYAGQLETDDLTRITTRFPCIYVIADGLQVTRRNNMDESRLALMLLLGDKNYRSNAAAARGTTTRPGVYAMLEAARDVLHRKKILTAWAPACLVSETPQVYDPQNGVCLYNAVYELQTMNRL